MNESAKDSRSLEGHIVLTAGLILIGCLWAAARDVGIGIRGLYLLFAVSAIGVEFFTKRRWGTLTMIASDLFLIAIAIFSNRDFRWYETLLIIIWSGATMHMAYSMKQQILASNEKLKCEHTRYVASVMIDPVTELKTQRAYLSEASIYLRLARRNSLEIALFLWTFKDENNIRERVGEHNFKMLVKKLSSLLRNHIRYEDLLYILEIEPYTWGMLMVTKKEFAGIIAKRQKDRLKEIMVPGLPDDWIDSMSVRFGVYDGGEDISPLTLYNRARKSDELVISD